MRRIVSVLYDDAGPFMGLADVGDYLCTSDPAHLKEGDILVVHGGADIHPSIYNKGRSSRSYAPQKKSARDEIEINMINKAKELNLPIIGICRGAQLLCALEGGYLIQHVVGHSGMHTVMTPDGPMQTNSIHHQMMQPAGDYELVGWMEHPRSDQYWDVAPDGRDLVDYTVEVEPEFVYYPKIKGFAVQWHPEMMPDTHPTNQWLINYINGKLS